MLLISEQSAILGSLLFASKANRTYFLHTLEKIKLLTKYLRRIFLHREEIKKNLVDFTKSNEEHADK